MEQNDFSNFSRESPKKHSYGINVKSGNWSTGIYRLKVLFLGLVALLLSRAEQFEQLM